MAVDSDTASVQFDEVDGPGPDVAEVEVETFPELEVASDLVDEFGADYVPLRCPKTGVVFGVPFAAFAEHLDNLIARSAA